MLDRTGTFLESNGTFLFQVDINTLTLTTSVRLRIFLLLMIINDNNTFINWIEVPSAWTIEALYKSPNEQKVILSFLLYYYYYYFNYCYFDNLICIWGGEFMFYVFSKCTFLNQLRNWYFYYLSFFSFPPLPSFPYSSPLLLSSIPSLCSSSLLTFN